MEYKYGNVDEVEQIIFCPLTDKPCREKRCAWWDAENELCVVMALLCLG